MQLAWIWVFCSVKWNRTFHSAAITIKWANTCECVYYHCRLSVMFKLELSLLFNLHLQDMLLNIKGEPGGSPVGPWVLFNPPTTISWTRQLQRSRVSSVILSASILQHLWCNGPGYSERKELLQAHWPQGTRVLVLWSRFSWLGLTFDVFNPLLGACCLSSCLSLIPMQPEPTLPARAKFWIRIPVCPWLCCPLVVTGCEPPLQEWHWPSWYLEMCESNGQLLTSSDF